MSQIKIYLKNNFRIYACDFKELLNNFLKTKKPNIIESFIYANTISTFAMIPYLISDETLKTIVDIKSDGVINNIILESENNVLRILIPNTTEIEKLTTINANELDLKTIIGTSGNFTITKQIQNNTFNSKIEFQNADFIHIFLNYFYKSEQVNTAIVENIKFNENNFSQLDDAEVIIFQKLPQALESDIDYFEKFIKNHSLSDLKLNTYIEILQAKYLKDINIEMGCFCTREKIHKVVVSLSKTDINKIIEKEHKLEITCQFCNQSYDFTDEYFSLLKIN